MPQRVYPPKWPVPPLAPKAPTGETAHGSARPLNEAVPDRKIQNFVAPTASRPNENSEIIAKLSKLSPARLAELLVAMAALYDADLNRILADFTAGKASAPAPENVEQAEPFMVGNSSAMHRVYAAIRRYANANAPVLITGESGTGKELVAQAIHERSACGKGPFVAINCGALPPTLIASELFGHERGAFTGATQRRIGRLEAANGGTVFLDEIGDLPLEMQVHLLRFLQEHTIDRVGGTRPFQVDARVIVATNVDLAQAISRGRFREDLFYRLNVLNLELPPLRERGEDIELLATFFQRKFAAEQDRVINGFTDGAWRLIRDYAWPGNVRELIGSIRRAVVVAESAWIQAHDLGLGPSSTGQRNSGLAKEPQRLRNVSDEQLRIALAANGGNVTRTAQALNVSRMTLYRHMRRTGVGTAES